MSATNTLILSREGIFPLSGGNTGLPLSGTLQGEGKLVGTPSMFVRLQGCNLRCIWLSTNGKPCQCDTAHTSFGPGDPYKLSVDEAFSILKQNMGAMRHVVITGGEPLIQATAVHSLIQRCNAEGWHTTVETNGTIYSPQIVRDASLLSISPKLSSSIPTNEKLMALKFQADNKITQHHRETISNLQPLANILSEATKYKTDVQLKFVVSSPKDEDEIKEHYAMILSLINPEDVLIMPMGFTHQEIAQSNQAAISMCLRNNWRYTPRLHIDLFGNKEGV